MTTTIFKKGGELQCWVTAYDFYQSSVLAECEVDAILVGMDLSQHFAGLPEGEYIAAEHMCYHIQVVARGAADLPIISSLPLSPKSSSEEVLAAAKDMMECGAHAIALTGGRDVIKQLEKLIENNIPVVGHVGLDQNIMKDWRLNGRDETLVQKIIEDSKLVANRGAKALILECIPKDLAQNITSQLKIPTIGIGAGIQCDGQLLLFDDIVGLSEADLEAKYIKRYSNFRQVMKQSVAQFKTDVKEKRFPNDRSSFV